MFRLKSVPATQQTYMPPKCGGKHYECGHCGLTYHHSKLWRSPNHEAFPPVYHEDGSRTEQYVCARCEAEADVLLFGDDEKKRFWETNTGRDGCGNSQPTLGGTLPGATKYVMLQRFVKASCKAP